MNKIRHKNLYDISKFQNIPAGWTDCTIEEICHIGRGRVISQEEINSNPGVYPVYSSQTRNNGKMGSIETYDFDGDYITWTTDGENAGTIFNRKGKFNCTNVCGTLKSKNDEVDHQFLAYQLSIISKNYVSYIGNPKLMNGVMANVGLILPAKPTQKKISKILNTVDNLIDQTQNLIDKYTAVKQGMMADLFSRGIDLSGTPETNKSYGQLRPSYKDAPELYQETKLGWIPADWEIANLGEVADVIDPQPDHRTPPESENGIPYVGVGDFYWDQRIDRERCRKVIEAAYDKQRGRFQVELGDSIFGKIGTIGQPKQLKETEGFALSANILLIKAKEKNDYVFSFFDSVFFNKQLSNIINTTSQPALGIQTMRDILITYPKCEKEQHSITEKLKAINDSIVALRKELHKYELIKEGLMQDLLTGKVKV